MNRLVFGGVVAVLLLAAGIRRGAGEGPPPGTPPLSAEYATRRDQVLPSPSERSYRKVPWRTSVLRGVVDAQKADRPVVIVLMNGHPLGCT